MTDRFQRLQAAFASARAEADPERRERIVLDACQGDPGLLAELRELLAAEPASDFLEVGVDRGADQDPPRQLGEFRLLRRIGSGASGVVWLARQPSLERDVALKVLAAGPGTSPAMLERFHRESLAVARLNHPHIVQVLAEGRGTDTHWFAMQFVDGHSVDVELRLQQARQPNDPLPLLPEFATGAWFAAVAHLCADAADALHTAHECGIVHRDVKPANLLLDRAGRVLVADFGIARDERFGSLTEAGAIAGTWHYMSPEQARVADEPIDHRTDVYSLGVVLYELLTLARPYEGSTSVEVIDKIRRSPPPAVRRSNRRVPRDLETICMAAMARQPSARYQTAAALRADLLRFLQHEAIVQQPPSLRERCAQVVRTYRRSIVMAFALLVAVFAGSGVEAGLRAAALRRESIALAESVLAAPTLEHESAARLAAAWLEVRDEAGRDPRCTAAAKVLDDYRDRLLAASRAPLVVADGEADDPVARREAIDTRLKNLLRASAVFPDDERIRAALPQVYTGEVAIAVADPAGNAVEARVACRLLDPLTGMPQTAIELGGAPIAAVRLEEGQYRFVVTTAGDGVREYDRMVRSMHRHTLRFVVRPLPQPPSGMVRLPGGDLQLPENGAPSGLNGTRVSVAPFWLDRCEVTVAAYRAFLTATGRSFPPFWSQLVPKEHDRLPVVYVTLADATAYAEWVGKRLPTYAEWALAARGPGSTPRRFPWGDDGMHGNVQVRPEAYENVAGGFSIYLRSAAAVDADPASCTPEGVFELFGNVAEWTSSFGVDVRDGGLVGREDKRIVAGHAWHVAFTNPTADLGQTMIADHGPTHAYMWCGFRCARSQEP